MLKNQKGYFIAALYLFGISQLAFAVESKERMVVMEWTMMR